MHGAVSRASPPPLRTASSTHLQSSVATSGNAVSVPLSGQSFPHDMLESSPQQPPSHSLPSTVELSPLQLVSRRSVDPYEQCKDQLDQFVKLQEEQIQLVRHLLETLHLHSTSDATSAAAAAAAAEVENRPPSSAQHSPAVGKSGKANEAASSGIVQRLRVLQRESAEFAESHCLPTLQRLLSTFDAYWDWKRAHIGDVTESLVRQRNLQQQQQPQHEEENELTSTADSATGKTESSVDVARRCGSGTEEDVVATGESQSATTLRSHTTSLRQRYDHARRVRDELRCFLQLHDDAVRALEPHLQSWIASMRCSEQAALARSDSTSALPVKTIKTTTTATRASGENRDAPPRQFVRFVQELLEVTQTTHHVALLMQAALQALCRPSPRNDTSRSGKRSQPFDNTRHAETMTLHEEAHQSSVLRARSESAINTADAAAARSRKIGNGTAPVGEPREISQKARESVSPSPRRATRPSSTTPPAQRATKTPLDGPAGVSTSDNAARGEASRDGGTELQGNGIQEAWFGVLSPLTPPPKPSQAATPVRQQSPTSSAEQKRIRNADSATAAPSPTSPPPRVASLSSCASDQVDKDSSNSSSSNTMADAAKMRRAHKREDRASPLPTAPSAAVRLNHKESGVDASAALSPSVSASAVSVSPLTVLRHDGAVPTSGTSARRRGRSVTSPSTSPSPRPSHCVGSAGGEDEEDDCVDAAAVSPAPRFDRATHTAAHSASLAEERRSSSSKAERQRNLGDEVRSLLSELTASAQVEAESPEEVYVPLVTGQRTASPSPSDGRVLAAESNSSSSHHRAPQSRSRTLRESSSSSTTNASVKLGDETETGEAAGSVGRAASVPAALWPQLRDNTTTRKSLEASAASEKESEDQAHGSDEGVDEGSEKRLAARRWVGEEDGPSLFYTSASIRNSGTASQQQIAVASSLAQRPSPNEGETVPADTFRSPANAIAVSEEQPSSPSATAAPVRRSQTHTPPSQTKTDTAPATTTEEEFEVGVLEQQAAEAEAALQRSAQLDVRKYPLHSRSEERRKRSSRQHHHHRRKSSRLSEASSDLLDSDTAFSSSSSSSSSSAVSSSSSPSSTPSPEERKSARTARKHHHHRSSHRRNHSGSVRHIEDTVHRELETLRVDQQRSLRQMQRDVRTALDEVVSVATTLASSSSSRASSRQSEHGNGEGRAAATEHAREVRRNIGKAGDSGRKGKDDSSGESAPNLEVASSAPRRDATAGASVKSNAAEASPSPAQRGSTAETRNDASRDASQREVESTAQLRESLAATEAKAARLEQLTIQLKKRLWLAEFSDAAAGEMAHGRTAQGPLHDSPRRRRGVSLRDAFVYGPTSDEAMRDDAYSGGREDLTKAEVAEDEDGVERGAALAEERAMLYLVDRALEEERQRQQHKERQAATKSKITASSALCASAAVGERKAAPRNSAFLAEATRFSAVTSTKNAQENSAASTTPSPLKCFDDVNDSSLRRVQMLHPDALLSSTLGRSPRIQKQRQSIFDRLRRNAAEHSSDGDAAHLPASNQPVEVVEMTSPVPTAGGRKSGREREAATQLSPPPPLQRLVAPTLSAAATAAAGARPSSVRRQQSSASVHPYSRSASAAPQGLSSLSHPTATEDRRFNGGDGGTSHYYAAISQASEADRTRSSDTFSREKTGHYFDASSDGVTGSSLRAEQVLENARRLLQGRSAAHAQRRVEWGRVDLDTGRLGHAAYGYNTASALSADDAELSHAQDDAPPPYSAVAAFDQARAKSPHAVHESRPIWAGAPDTPQRYAGFFDAPDHASQRRYSPHRTFAASHEMGVLQSPSAEQRYYHYDTSPCSAVAYSSSKVPRASPHRENDRAASAREAPPHIAREVFQRVPSSPAPISAHLSQPKEGFRHEARIAAQRVDSATSPVASPVSTREGYGSRARPGTNGDLAQEPYATSRSPSSASHPSRASAEGDRGSRRGSSFRSAMSEDNLNSPQEARSAALQPKAAQRRVQWQHDASPIGGFDATSRSESRASTTTTTLVSTRGSAQGELMDKLTQQEDVLHRALRQLQQQRQQLEEKRGQVAQLASAAVTASKTKAALPSRKPSAQSRLGNAAGATSTRSVSATGRAAGARAGGAVTGPTDSGKLEELMCRFAQAETTLSEKESRVRQAIHVLQRQRAALEDDNFL